MFITQFSTVVVMNTLCDAFPSWIFCHFLLSSFSPSILLAYQFLANLASFDCPQFLPLYGVLTACREKQHPGHRLRSILPLMNNGGFIELAHSGGCFGVPFRLHYCILCTYPCAYSFVLPFLLIRHFPFARFHLAFVRYQLRLHQASSSPITVLACLQGPLCLLACGTSEVVCISQPVARSSVLALSPQPRLIALFCHVRRSRIGAVYCPARQPAVSFPSLPATHSPHVP